MEPVNDLKHFSSLIKQTKSAEGVLISNSFLLPDEIQKYTQQKKLFATSLGDGIGFLRETDNFYQLVFYLAGKKDIEFSRKEKPVVINLVHRDSNRADALQGMDSRWIECGFIRYKSNKRMSFKPEGITSAHFDDALTSSNGRLFLPGRCQPALDTHLDELMTLWRDALDRFSNPLPSREEIREMAETQQILCTLDPNDHIIGALHFMTANKVCTIQHVAVDKNHRRLGLARLMVQYCLSNCADVLQYALWVEAENTPAIQLYTSLGFTFDGMYSDQFMLF